MKKILRVSLMLVAVICFFSSCSSDDDDDDLIIEYASLPTNAKSLIETHFADATVTLVKEKYVADDNSSYYDVYLNSDFKIDFNKSGYWLSIDGNRNALPNSLFGSEIPLAIKTDANTQYPGIAIVDIEKTTYGFNIELSSGIDLMYKTTAEFIGKD